MKTLSIYNEAVLARLYKLQREKAWDFESSIDWKIDIDLNKPLVALDENAILFPGASSEERLAISQMMGLVISACICETEESLERLRTECWENVVKNYPVSPEFWDLGEQFFEEEQKHSRAFRRYLHRFAEKVGIEYEELLGVLPHVKDTRTEAILRNNLRSGGQAFWWIVASIEQEFLLLYHSLAPFQKSLEPLYFQLHQRHFEEEARHASFPYLMLELLLERRGNLMGRVHAKGDLAVAQVVQLLWTFKSLDKVKNAKRLASVHPMFDALSRVYSILEVQSPAKVLWQMMTRAPYVSSLVNPGFHPKVTRYAQEVGAWSLPFPEAVDPELVEY